MMKLWIYENHICELRSEELFEGRSSQLYATYAIAKRKPYKPDFFFHAFFSQLHKLRITVMIFFQITRSIVTN